MDFFQFLQNSKNEVKSEKVKKIKNTFEKTKQHTQHNDKDYNNTINNTTNENVSVYKNIQKGNMVKIIYKEKSPLNSYKGYIGEVRDYKRDQDFALIFLHCINSSCVIKFPLEHFIVIP